LNLFSRHSLSFAAIVALSQNHGFLKNGANYEEENSSFNRRLARKCAKVVVGSLTVLSLDSSRIHIEITLNYYQQGRQRAAREAGKI
jgi:hypothetical protein